MTESQRKKLDRVFKLLQMTVENGCTQAEADTAKKQAEKILKENDLSMKDVDNKDYVWSKDYIYKSDDEDAEMYTRLPSWVKALYNGIGVAFGVAVFISRDEDRNGCIVFAGTESDIEMMDYCVECIWSQIMDLSEEYRIANRLRRNSALVNSFLESIVHGINLRLAELLANVKSNSEGAVASSGRDLTLYDESLARREIASEWYKKETGSKIRKASSSSRLNNDGISASSKVKVHGAMNGNGKSGTKQLA